MQSVLDGLLAESVQRAIEENLGETTTQKIKDRLFERHGINLTQAIKDFHKFDSVLREFFGHGAEGLVAELFKNIIKTENNISKDWISIQDQGIAKTFLEALGDHDKKAILNSVLDVPLTIAEILENCEMPQTSGYRKINSLINDALLIQKGQHMTANKKRVTKYESIFKNINIEVGKNCVKINIQMKEEILEESSVLRMVRLD